MARALTGPRGLASAFVIAASVMTAGCGDGGGSSASASGGFSGQGLLKIPLPAPSPLPEPLPLPALGTTSYSVAGVVRVPIALDTLTTRSGHWRFSDLGAVGIGAHAYLWRLDENADFVRVMICRRADTVEAGDSSAWTVTTVPVAITDRGHSYSWSLTVAPGACRVMQNIEPVAAHADWLRDAVATGRLPSYDRGRAWGPYTLPTLALDPQRGAYDPSSLGPIPGSSDAPSSMGNYVGVTSAQGGEYASSRGFLHNADARVVDAAVHGEDAAIAAFMPEFTQYSWYSLAQPEGGQWSELNKTTVDPQLPMLGDRPYEYAIAGPRVRPDIDSVIPPATPQDWSRDPAHLEDTGFVHWILTEDPVAGMVVQRQLAFHLANYYEYRRETVPTSYGINMEQERGLYNGLSALWKARDVARRVTSTNGTVIWGQPRVDKMVSDGIANIDAQAGAFTHRDVARITGTLLVAPDVEIWALTNGTTVNLASNSNFQLIQYGKEPLWLWTRDGNATVTGWFKAAARHIVVRALYIGGALGVDRAEDTRGSSLPLGPATTDSGGYPVPAPTPFRTDVDWAKWVVAQPFAPQSTTSFDASSLHTVQQMYGMLLFARDANLGTPDLDAAIAKMQADNGRTSAFRWPELLAQKHLAGPPPR